ncbi:hypothetical protein FQA39_LY17449 [Lamprigera yunnana]|nr:hypothetical protein FQA39_LY17449 [Lamprigera yunnana]
MLILIDTWDEARRKLKIAEEKSDVNTTDVEDKTSRKIKKRYSRPSSYSNSDEKVSQKYRKVAKKISKPSNAPSVNENNSAIHRTHVDEILTSVSDHQNTYTVLNSASMNLNYKHANMSRNEEGESTSCTSRRSTPLSHLSSLSTGIRENPTINDYDNFLSSFIVFCICSLKFCIVVSNFIKTMDSVSTSCIQLAKERIIEYSDPKYNINDFKTGDCETMLLNQKIYYLNKYKSKWISVGLYYPFEFASVVKTCDMMWKPRQIGSKTLTFEMIEEKKILRIAEKKILRIEDVCGNEVYLGWESVSEVWSLETVLNYRLSY